MNTYQVTVLFGASKSVTVKSASPDEAIEAAYNHDEMHISLCHQCCGEIEIGDPYEAVVYDEKYTTKLADDRHSTNEVATLRQQRAFDEAEILHLRQQLAQSDLALRESRQNDAESMRQLAEAKQDEERIDWLGIMFNSFWNGVVDSGSRKYWQLVGDYRHRVQKMQGNTFREAIDAARTKS